MKRAKAIFRALQVSSGFRILWLGLNSYDWRVSSGFYIYFASILLMQARSPIFQQALKPVALVSAMKIPPLQPGEFRDIDVVGGTLQGSLMPLPFKEPSGTLYNLLGTLVDAGRRFASMADMKVGEMSGETPVGTTMAIMERGTKVMSAIPQAFALFSKEN